MGTLLIPISFSSVSLTIQDATLALQNFSVDHNMLTISSSHSSHHYHRCLYDHLGRDIVELAPSHPEDQDRELLSLAAKSDIFHLHWPEHIFDGHVPSVVVLISRIKLAGTKVVWTQHNIQPHRNLDRGKELYHSVASMVDAVIHHSECGKKKALKHLEFNKNCLHATIRHGHFGSMVPADILHNRTKIRHEIEKEYQLYPASLRLGIIGAPRPGKNTLQFVEAFASVDRPELGLFSLGSTLEDSEIFPCDARITAIPYSFVERDTYYRRLCAIDLIILPFSPDTTMLTTGLIADAMALDIPCARTSWDYLEETLGPNAILMGDTKAAQVAFLNKITPPLIEIYRAKIKAIKTPFEWPLLASDTLHLLNSVASHPRNRSL